MGATRHSESTKITMIKQSAAKNGGGQIIRIKLAVEIPYRLLASGPNEYKHFPISLQQSQGKNGRQIL